MSPEKILIGGAALFFALNLSSPGFCQQRQDVQQLVKIAGLEDALRKGADIYRDEIKKNYPEASPSFYRALDSDLSN